MIERRIVRRYAAALFSAASKAGIADRVESDLGLVSYTLEMSRDLMDAMASPLVPASKKRSIVDAIFTGKVEQTTLAYLHLLIGHRREDAMAQTEQEYVQLANAARGIVEVEAISAVELTKEEQSRLQQELAKLTGKTAQLVLSVDESLMGGLLVRIGDRVIDGSIRGQLAALKERLLG